MSPETPIIRGTGQNPDVYFQGRETVNKYYLACPGIVQEAMDKFAKLIGRQYHLFDYVGAPMPTRHRADGLRGRAAHEAVDYLTAEGEKVGLLKVRLYRPFSVEHFADALPKTRQDGGRAGPHQGARRGRRAAVPGRASRPLPKTGLAGHPVDRRPLRAVQQGVHPRDGQGRLRRAGHRTPRRTTSPSASTTT